MDDHSNFGHFLRVHVFLIGVVKGGFISDDCRKARFDKSDELSDDHRAEAIIYTD